MLVLSRKVGQRIQTGSNVTVTVLGYRGDQIQLGFTGPVDVPIHREEVYRRIEQEEALDRSIVQSERQRTVARPALRAG